MPTKKTAAKRKYTRRTPPAAAAEARAALESAERAQVPQPPAVLESIDALIGAALADQSRAANRYAAACYEIDIRRLTEARDFLARYLSVDPDELAAQRDRLDLD